MARREDAGNEKTVEALLDVMEARGLRALDELHEIRERPPGAVREAVLSRLERAEGSGLDSGGLVEFLLTHVGLGDDAPRVTALVLDSGRSRTLRASLAYYLAVEAPPLWNELLDGDALPEGDDTLPMEAGVRRRLLLMSVDGSKEGLLPLLEGIDPSWAEDLSAKIEALRRAHRIDAVLAYGEALTREALASFHPVMLAAVAEEATPEGIALLEGLLTRAEGERRTALHRTLVRARTRLIDPGSGAPAPEGEAWVSTTDPEGRVGIFARFPHPDGREDAVTLIVSRAGELPQGGLMPLQPPDVLDGLVSAFQGSGVIGLAPATPAQAGHVVRRVLEDTGLDAVPSSCRAAVDLLLRCARTQPELPMPEPHPEPKPPALAALLERRYYATWATPREVSEGLQRVDPEAPPDDSVVRMIRGIERMRAAVEHMARWHALAGDDEAARLMSTVHSSQPWLGLLIAMRTPRE